MDDTHALLEQARAKADQLAREVAEAKLISSEQLQHATDAVEALRDKVAALEGELHALTQEQARASTPAARALPFVLLGLSAPLAFVAAFLFFHAGVWPVGLLGLIFSVVAGFTIPYEARRER